jgi:hypothetical protein
VRVRECVRVCASLCDCVCEANYRMPFDDLNYFFTVIFIF